MSVVTLYFDPASIHAELHRVGFFDKARAGGVDLSHGSNEYAIAWRTPADQQDGPAQAIDIGVHIYQGLKVRLVEWREAETTSYSGAVQP